MAYEQAQIAVQKTQEFEQLKSAIERVFGSESLQKFYRRLESKDVRAREFEQIVNSRLLEQVDATLARSGKTGKELWQSLSLSDRALMREFYLERIEQVDAKVRQKFSKVYRYY